MELKELEAKRQEVRALFRMRFSLSDSEIDDALEYLSSCGVVLADPKGELPICTHFGNTDYVQGVRDGWGAAENEMLKAGYRQTYELEGK